jgi:hypothetical protein
VRAVAFCASQNRSAGAQDGLNSAHQRGPEFATDQRTHVGCVVDFGAEANLGCLFNEALGQVLYNRSSGNDPLCADAILPGSPEGAVADRGCRAVKVGVGRDADDADAAELEDELFEPGTTRDPVACFAAARERYDARTIVADERSADFGAPVDDLDPVSGRAALIEMLN